MTSVKIKKVNNYMALLRNLVNLDKVGVSDEHIDKVAAALTHEPAIKYSKQLPFRFFSAHNMLVEKNANPKLIKATEKALDLSVANLPKFKGKVASLTDNSGSAWGAITSKMGSVRIGDIANLSGVLTGMITEGEAYVHPFGDRLSEYKVEPNKTALSQMETVTKLGSKVGGGSETGIWIFWDEAIKEKKHYDYVFVYSDMQAGHGSLYANTKKMSKTHKWTTNYSSYYNSLRNFIDVPSMISDYRKTVNPNVQVFLVQVAGYNDTIIPEYYDKTYILGGWSDGILKFAHKVSQLNP